MGEVLELLCKHIELKQLEAREGTEYQIDWHGTTPVVRETCQRPAGRPLREILHIKAAAQHRRLMEQAAQGPSSGPVISAAATQGQAVRKTGMRHSILGDPA